MRFGILGPLQLRGRTGEFGRPGGGPRLRALLALLLLEAGHIVGTEQLLDRLYPEGAGGSSNALQALVSRLRRELGDHDRRLIEFHPAGYRLATDPDEVDAHRFTRLARSGHRALTSDDPVRAAELLVQAAELWRGPALADLPLNRLPYARAQADRLEELRSTAAEDLAAAQLALGRPREALEAAERLTAAHPLRERPRLLRMRALHAEGRGAEALTVYEETRRLLADELGTDPSAELSALHLEILRGTPAPTQPAGQPSAPPRGPSGPSASSRLPAQLTSFIGRENDLHRLRGLLTAHRLVTLLGPGGTGKTRLAVEAAATLDAEVRFVDLSPVATPDELPQALLTALDVRDHALRGGAPAVGPVQRLTTALAERELLLLLDNCEHLIAPAAELTHRLLTACPRLRVLATSREPLGITGEALLPLAPLPGPAAVRLFTERAAAVHPGFAENMPAASQQTVRQICTALDGLPLAIELAAARLRTLPLEQIADRLDDRFRLLSRGSRTAAPRHRTLNSVVEWSWELLSPPERRLAARLTVFSGGATAAAAAAVCAPDQDPAEVEDLLSALTDKSLLDRSGGRHRMLETIRAYGAGRLDEAGEYERLRAAHAAHFLEFARTADPHLLSAEQLDRLSALDAERANLHTALRRAIPADPPQALRLMAALSTYWWLRGLRTEAIPLAAELLRRAPRDAPETLPEEYVLCVLHATAGGAPLDPGLRAHLDRAEQIMTAYRLRPRHRFTTVLWALSAGPPTEGIPADVGQVLGPDPWSQALGPLSLGFRHHFRGELDAARARFEEALAGFRAVGDRWGSAQTLDALTVLANARGDHRSALALTDQALVLLDELGAGEDTADLLCTRAATLLALGDLSGAESGYRRAAETALRAGTPLTVDQTELGLGEVARRRGDLAEARRRYEAAVRPPVGHAYQLGEVSVRARIGLAHVLLTTGQPAAARTHFTRSLADSQRPLNLPIAALAAAGLAATALAEGDPEQAAVLLGAAESWRGAPLSAADPETAGTAERVRAALGEERCTAARARGAGLDPAAVLALPTSAVPAPPP